MRLKPLPLNREGWFLFYVAMFNRLRFESSATLAIWYLLLALQDGEDWTRELT